MFSKPAATVRDTWMSKLVSAHENGTSVKKDIDMHPMSNACYVYLHIYT